jgi:hypothetical protein
MNPFLFIQERSPHSAGMAEAQMRPFEKSADVSCRIFEIQCSRRQLVAGDKSVNQYCERLHEDARRKITAQGCAIFADVIRNFCLQDIVEGTGTDLEPSAAWS